MDGTFKPLFIRLSPNCTYYYKSGDLAAVQCNKSERHEQGRCFAGRVAAVVKGIKFSPDGKEIAPIIHVCQVLELEPLPTTNVVDTAHTACILDDDIEATTNAMNADTEDLNADVESAFLAFIKAEHQRLDEENDSAYASIN